MTFKSAYTFSPGNSYKFKVWTFDPNNTTDEYIANDTIYFNYKHAGSPNIPTASNVINCGAGSVSLKATASVSDSIIWYDASTGGNILKLGENYKTPVLKTTTTFYAEANAFKSSICLSTNKFILFLV